MDKAKTEPTDSQYMNEHVKPFFLEGAIKDECILMIHGYTGSPADMLPLAQYLNNSGKGYTVACILLPGHGTQMDDLLAANWKKWVLYASGELKSLQEKYPKVSIVGFSMGGDIALCLASKFNVNRIVTICTPIMIMNKLNYIAEFLSIFKKYTYWRTGSRIEGELEHDYETGYAGMPVRSIAEVRNLTIVTINRLRRVKQPILIIQSLNDRTVHPRSPYIIFDKIESDYKELLLLEKSRHNPIYGIEREKLYSTVDSFLKKQVPDKSKILTS